MLDGEKLERIFISCPTVKIFIENKERGVFYTSSLKDVGGRDNDVYDNIMYVYDHGNLNKAINIKSFYRLGTSTMIQVKIESAASQENIYQIFQEALDTAILSETDFGNNWYNIITFFENLKTIAYLLGDGVFNFEIIKNIYRCLRFMQYISNEVDIKLIKEKYDLFKARKIVPNDTPPFCKLSNIVNILGDEAGGFIPRGNIYPINMMYEDNKFSTDIAGVISNACYRINKFDIDIDIDEIDARNNTVFLEDFCDRVFSIGSAQILKRSLSKYMMLNIISNKNADGDIVIKFIDDKYIVALAKITPKSEIIVWCEQ